MKKIALVTGAAKGIGKAIATELAKVGCDVIINYHTSKDEAEILAKSLSEQYGVTVVPFGADVSSEAEVEEMAKFIEGKFGGIDILVNNAAIDLSGLWNEKTVDDFKKTLDVNLLGAYITSRRFYRHMIDKKWGRIINISSTNGINTYYPMCIEYDASKAALISLTHNLAVKCAPYITVNAVVPGFIGTESELDGYTEEFLKMEQEKILLGRYGEPEEVAKLVRFLASDDASYINNSIIRIDGGQAGA